MPEEVKEEIKEPEKPAEPEKKAEPPRVTIEHGHWQISFTTGRMIKIE